LNREVYKTQTEKENPRDTQRACVLKYLGRMHLRCIFPPEDTAKKLLNELAGCVGNRDVGCCSWRVFSVFVSSAALQEAARGMGYPISRSASWREKWQKSRGILEL